MLIFPLIKKQLNFGFLYNIGVSQAGQKLRPEFIQFHKRLFPNSLEVRFEGTQVMQGAFSFPVSSQQSIIFVVTVSDDVPDCTVQYDGAGTVTCINGCRLDPQKQQLPMTTADWRDNISCISRLPLWAEVVKWYLYVPFTETMTIPVEGEYSPPTSNSTCNKKIICQ